MLPEQYVKIDGTWMVERKVVLNKVEMVSHC